MTEKPYTDADVELTTAAFFKEWTAHQAVHPVLGECDTEEPDEECCDRHGIRAALDALAAAGRLQEGCPMTDRDRCTDTNPHPAHRTQYGGFGVKDCPGVPMTSREELRAERVTTGRLEGNLRSQTRAVREALAERDAARNDAKQAAQLADFRQGVIDRYRQELGAAGEVLAVVRDAVERIDRALATYDTTPGEPTSEEVRWAYRWIGTDGQVYDEMDASDNAIETAEQRAHRIAAKRLTGTVRGEVLRYRVLTMPAEVVATYPAEARP